MDNPDQALQPARIIDKESILALSWHIATDPKLYWKLAVNPYTHRAQQLISEKFPHENIVDVIRAVILAEPEGGYDRSFKLLETEQQKESLRKQKDKTAAINKQLVQYCKKHAKAFNRYPHEFIYNCLSFFIFTTTDVKKIEKKYSQDQRRNFKLAIINFIEKTEQMKSASQQKKLTSSRQHLLIIFVTLVPILLFYIIQSVTYHGELRKQFLATGAQKENQRLPIRLKIPKINLDALVEYVGVTREGSMDVPGNITNVGWYQFGAIPGEIGSAVISGHFDGKKGDSGVFNNLGELKQGDMLYVIDTQGTITTFMVRESRIYNPGYAEEVFLSKDSGIHLNLITCDGVWSKSKKSYSERLVVFTDIVY